MGGRVRVGIVGCGWVTEYRHLPALRRLPEAEVIAVADVDEIRLNRVADRFHLPSRHTDFRALLGDPAIDAVAVCTPLTTHAEIGLAALDAGKHLLIEKPLAASLEECDRLIARAQSADRTAMVGLNLRWHRLVRQAREICRSGVLGSILMANTVLASYHPTIPAWREQRAEGGGVLCEQAVHMYDLWRYVLDTEVDEVFATTRTGRWREETATVTGRLADGTLVSSEFSWGTGNVCYLDIYGERGRLQVDCLRFDGLQLLGRDEHPGDLGVRLRRLPAVISGLAAVPAAMREGGAYLASYREEWRRFLEAAHRRQPIQPTLQDGRRALEVILAAQASADLRRPVRLAELERLGVATPSQSVARSLSGARS
ncbi:MAG TPA: Gfo/Idh/MocA family oxidoreductase [bacterium]